MSPEFSPELKKKIEEVVSHYPKKEAALLPILHIVQREKGFISPEDETLVAHFLQLKPVKVREVTTFYTMFYREPIGKYHIQVCSNLSCSLLGAGSLAGFLKEKLGIDIGETTGDKKFTLSIVECLGACEQAPCMMVNFDYYGNLDRERVDKILEGLT